MYKVKLIKGLSYTGAVHATKNEPYVTVEDEATAKALVASGYFEIVEAVESNDGEDENDGDAPNPDDSVDIDKMTVPQLEAYAAEKGIDLAGCSNKTEKLAKIKEAVESNDGAADDGAADYGED